MELISLVWDNVVPFLFVLTVLVFFHELGHYWVARRAGVRVDVFSVGFGREIFGWTDRKGTRWKISLIPLGGYVKMFGEETSTVNERGEERPLTEAEREVSFAHKSVGWRAAIVVAGPLANFLLAIVLFAVLFGAVGSPRLLPFVAEVQPGTAADEAGFRPGDRILSVDGEPIEWFDDLRKVIADSPGVRVEILVRRDGQEIVLPATPKIHEAEAADGTVRRIGLLGVSADASKVEHIRYSPGEAAWRSVEATVSMSVRILDFLGQVIVGERPATEMGGPLMIAKMSSEVAQGGFIDLLNWIAVLSINLGLINLFPIPILDGGHLVFFMAEALRGKPLTQRFQEYGFRFGLILVFLLMIFVTWNDLVHQLKVFEFLKGLIT